MKIIEIAPQSYILQGTDIKVEFPNITGNTIDECQCFKINDKYGISRNHTIIIVSAQFNEVRCVVERDKHDNNKKILKYFEYRIDLRDESKNPYHVYGRILTDGTIFQDIRLYDRKRKYYDVSRFLRLPSYNYVFICKLFGHYYLYKDYSGYGVLEYNDCLAPQNISPDDYTNNYPYDSFSFKVDTYGSYLCLYRNRYTNNKEIFRECRWFLYSPILQEGRFEKGFTAVTPTRSYFWIIKNGENYGMLDSYLRQIVPPCFSKIDLGEERNIDYIVLSDKSDKYGVLKLEESSKASIGKLSGDVRRDRAKFFREFSYEIFIPFEYNNIERKGDYLILENIDELQCVYSIKESKRLTPFAFSNNWNVLPETIGEGLIGAYLKGHNSYRTGDEPSLKYAFFDINSGKVILELAPNLWIERGFKNGKAQVKSTDWVQYKIDRNGKLYEIVTRQSLCQFEQEEDWNPYWNEYSEDEADNFYGLTDGMEGDLW